jgi:hypothetical protein
VIEGHGYAKQLINHRFRQFASSSPTLRHAARSSAAVSVGIAMAAAAAANINEVDAAVELSTSSASLMSINDIKPSSSTIGSKLRNDHANNHSNHYSAQEGLPLSSSSSSSSSSPSSLLLSTVGMSDSLVRSASKKVMESSQIISKATKASPSKSLTCKRMKADSNHNNDNNTISDTHGYNSDTKDKSSLSSHRQDKKGRTSHCRKRRGISVHIHIQRFIDITSS